MTDTEEAGAGYLPSGGYVSPPDGKEMEEAQHQQEC